MKIEICEDNGDIQPDGKPTLVVLVVTNDNGQQKRLPYEATKTIQELYGDVKKLAFNGLISKLILPNPSESFTTQKPISNYNEIEREDLVKIVGLAERDEFTDEARELSNGMIVRVMEVIRRKGQVVGYEIVNDKAALPIRLTISASEVILHEKFVKKPVVRVNKFEIIKQCVCKEQVALELNGNMYEGKCPACGTMLSEKRVENVSTGKTEIA